MGSAAVRREKRKRQKLREQQTNQNKEIPTNVEKRWDDKVKYLPEQDNQLSSLMLDPEMRRVYERFFPAEEFETNSNKDLRESDQSALDDEYSFTQTEISNKRKKKMMRVSLAELKKSTPHPEVVELEDCSSKCPMLLIQLKCARNTIPVPKHWSRKRKYLAGKRGFVKPPFELPPFIRDTGVCEQREAVRSIDDNKSLKAKARDRMHPKLGRLAVNYEKLYDAFFKYQTKPLLSSYGQVYFEGREGTAQGSSEGRRRGMRPGMLSDSLREALGMTGTHPATSPPPWLFNMQRFGAPPSYPHLRLPGVNAPLPDGAMWGYHPGGWGRAPDGMFDATDIAASESMLKFMKPVDRSLWGELEPEPTEE